MPSEPYSLVLLQLWHSFGLPNQVGPRDGRRTMDHSKLLVRLIGPAVVAIALPKWR